MISTQREDLKGAFGLSELYEAQALDRLEYRGRPQLWGVGRRSAEGDGTPRSSPVQVYSSGNWTSGELGIYDNSQALFLLDNTGKLSNYGNNSNDWLGLGGIVGNQLNGTWAKVKPGGWRFCFGLLSDDSTYPFKPNGVLKGWGYNNWGQLGQNNTTQYASPVQVPGAWRDFYPYPNVHSNGRGSASYFVSPNMFALTRDDQLWAWGFNLDGMLGQSNGTHYSSPVQIPGTWKSFQRMGEWCGGVKDDNQLYMWGNNRSGQLGQNNTASYSSPVGVANLGSVRWRTLINSHNMDACYAVKQDGSLWAWGVNSNGELGQNDVAPRSSPVPIPGSWELVIPKDSNVLAMQAGTGIIYGWGSNGNYILGDSMGAKSKPTPLPGRWDSRYGIWYNGQTAYAVKRNRSEGDFQGLYVWGRNDYGQASVNNTDAQSWPRRTSFFPQAFWGQRLDQFPSNFNDQWALTAYIPLRK